MTPLPICADQSLDERSAELTAFGKKLYQEFTELRELSHWLRNESMQLREDSRVLRQDGDAIRDSLYASEEVEA